MGRHLRGAAKPKKQAKSTTAKSPDAASPTFTSTSSPAGTATSPTHGGIRRLFPHCDDALDQAAATMARQNAAA